LSLSRADASHNATTTASATKKNAAAALATLRLEFIRGIYAERRRRVRELRPLL
jgi:hypothetical protein